jgi:hypothetical protein
LYTFDVAYINAALAINGDGMSRAELTRLLTRVAKAS